MAAWRSGAVNLWNAGADGLYVFNGFHGAPIDVYQQIGDLGTLANKDKISGADRFDGGSSFSEAREVELQRERPQFSVRSPPYPKRSTSRFKCS